MLCLGLRQNFRPLSPENMERESLSTLVSGFSTITLTKPNRPFGRLLKLEFDPYTEPKIWVETPGNIEAVFNKTHNTLRVAPDKRHNEQSYDGETCGQARKAFEGMSTIPETVPVHDVVIKTNGMTIRQACDLHGTELPHFQGWRRSDCGLAGYLNNMTLSN